MEILCTLSFCFKRTWPLGENTTISALKSLPCSRATVAPPVVMVLHSLNSYHLRIPSTNACPQPEVKYPACNLFTPGIDQSIKLKQPFNFSRPWLLLDFCYFSSLFLSFGISSIFSVNSNPSRCNTTTART